MLMGWSEVAKSPRAAPAALAEGANGGGRGTRALVVGW